MKDKIQKLRDYSTRKSYDGITSGISLSAVAVILADYYEYINLENPSLIAIPLGASFLLNAFNDLKYGADHD